MRTISQKERDMIDKIADKVKQIPDGEQVCVAGISGKYPECSSIEEFATRLYNNEDMVKEDVERWRKDFLPPNEPVEEGRDINELDSRSAVERDLFNTPMGMGKLQNLEKFDASFFGCDDAQANSIDSQIRILIESVYEALWDSGTVPESMSGSNTGVFIGNCFDEILNAHSTVGTVPQYKQYMAAQVSHRFNFRGPSLVVDTACASCFSALNEALRYMRHNRCESAIVAGVNLGLNPMIQYQFFKLNMLSPDGKCKCLDASANGYAKGEAIVAVFLQRKRFAKRIYATVVHTKTNNDGYEEMGITFPTWESQRDLMKACYAEAGVNPHDVGYVEAHCTGTQAGDPEEMRAICESMCSGGRKEPLLIGAHKSNIGHTEATSGLCAMSKVIISLENECIPANIHFHRANPKVEGIQTGQLKPINENTPFFGDTVGLNNFGFGGSNIHVIIKSPKIKPSMDNNIIVDRIPRLIQMCGRNEKSINYFFESLLNKPQKITRDLLSLINDISKTSPFKTNTAYDGMTSRGFALIESLDQNMSEIQNFNVRDVTEKDRQIWFVLSGMGTQWSAMAKDLIGIEVFQKSIRNLCQIMRKYSIDLWSLLMNESTNICDSVMNSFLTIAAIQIALIDLLEELDIRPDGIIGHSIGELVCAYADKCLTAEETIVMAYWRAKCVEDNAKTRGRMVAVRMGAKEAKPLCPSNVYIACDNSDDSVTISGDNRSVEEFVKVLKDKDIFTTNVESSGIAFHSSLMYAIGEQLTAKLTTVMSGQRKVSARWISTTAISQPKTIGANYFADNLLYPVLFNDGLKKIPNNAIVIEISPHCLFQSIIKRTLGPNISYIPLMRKNDNNLNLLLSSVGTLYTSGLNPSIEKLYPKVEYPVSNGTLFISPLVKWIHDKDYLVTKYPDYFSVFQSRATQTSKYNGLVKYIETTLSAPLSKWVDILQDKDDAYITGHVIDGRNLYPGTGYLLLVWKHLATIKNKEYEDLAVEFRDVTFHRATLVQSNRELAFQTTIDISSGDFVLTESEAVVVTGNISVLTTGLEFQYYLEEQSYRLSSTDKIVLDKQDVYTSLRLRGYDYGKSFQCVSEAYVENRKVKALVDWTDNWVVFSDNMIQIGILGIDSKGLFIPVRLDLIRFDPKLLLTEVETMDSSSRRLEAVFDYDTKIGVAKGLEYREMKANLVQRNLNLKPGVGHYEFLPYEGSVAMDAFFPERQKSLLEYRALCDELAEELDKKFQLIRSIGKNAKIISIKSKVFAKTFKEKNRYLYSFLKDLQTVSEYDIQAIKANENYKQLSDDFLIESVYNKWLVDGQLIICYDNKKSIDFKVLELNDSTESIRPLLTDSYEPYDYNIKLNYTLVYRSPDLLSEDSKAIGWPLNESHIPSNLNDMDLIIYKNDCKDSIDLTKLFDSVWDALKVNGFFQIVFRDKFTKSEELVRNLLDVKSHTMDRNRIRSAADKRGFTYIGWNYNQFGANTMLFRKITTDLQIEKQVFIEISMDFSHWLEKLKEEIKSIHKRPEGENIWLIANNSAKNGILGFVYCLKTEVNGKRIRCIFNFNGPKDEFFSDCEDFNAIVKKDLVCNVFKDNAWGYYKSNIGNSITRTVQTEHCFLNTSTRGDLSSLKWFECQHKYWPIGRKDNQLLCYVYYSALNFRDIMLATGRLPADALPGDIALQDCILGLEFSGRDENGNRVMGMIPSKALATTCVVEDTEFLWPIPEHWSMEEASTVPCVYATAYYSLIIRGNLKRGEKVLIHSGSGGVGQAAINICLDLDCQLFVTVGSAAKRDYLKKLFPTLTDRNFSSSRDLSFKTLVMNATNGLGVDLVLNSLSDDKLKASIECLGNNGRFLEIGKYDMSVNTRLDMSEMLKNKSFHGILLDALFTADEKTPKIVLNDRKSIWKLISNGIKTGTVKPLDRSIFAVDECEEAFRFMASGKHMGKVVIKIRDEEAVERIAAKAYRMSAIARTVFNPNRVYILTGALGGFGIELIDWMIEREAKKFVITSRSGPKTGYQKAKLKYYRDMKGADIHVVCNTDLSSPNEAMNLLKIASNYGPIGGVFHLVLELVDALFENQTEDLFKTICRSKSDAFIVLDIVCRKYCPDLEYFVGFSSGVATRGNVGQTNYGFSNSIIDRVCELRKSDGYNGLAIQWGVIGDVGIVVKSTGSDDAVIAGTVAQRVASCLQTLDALLQTDKAIAFSFIKSEPKLESSGGKQNFLKKLAHIMGMDDLKKMDPNMKLVKLGMDSLMAVEIQVSVERECDVVLSAQEVRDMTIANIMDIASGSEK